jgi:hypothetical protein
MSIIRGEMNEVGNSSEIRSENKVWHKDILSPLESWKLWDRHW